MYINGTVSLDKAVQDQGLVVYHPQASHRDLQIKFYWKTCPFIYMYQWLLPASTAELNSCRRDYMTRDPKIFTIWPLKENFVDPYQEQ